MRIYDTRFTALQRRGNGRREAVGTLDLLGRDAGLCCVRKWRDPELLGLGVESPNAVVLSLVGDHGLSDPFQRDYRASVASRREAIFRRYTGRS